MEKEEVWGTARRVAIDFSSGESNTDTVVSLLILLFYFFLPSVPYFPSSFHFFVLVLSHFTQVHLLEPDLDWLNRSICCFKSKQPELCDSGLTQA